MGVMIAAVQTDHDLHGIELFQHSPVHISVLTARTSLGTVTARLSSLQNSINDGLGAPNANTNRYGIKTAVFGASAAFHTGVPVNNGHGLSLPLQHGVGANIETEPAGRTLVTIQFKCNSIS
jgi:hypothetical protein